ncbi:MAG: hypothetical protein GVY19_05575 [Bacteroidetes bacterium]|jgi:hypothetical protein|nr:hypothetical protein [Bacteroidota bacterium]
MINELEKIIKDRYGSWTDYSESINMDKKNVKRYFARNIDKLNEMLEPLGVELSIKEKVRVISPGY